MKQVTFRMINDFRMKELGYDFMGYTFDRTNQLSFHHLIVPHRYCGKEGLGNGYYYWNGAILTKSQTSNSHDYLHLIERCNFDMFLAITSELIDENISGKLCIKNLKAIRDILVCFERENCGKRDSQGKQLIKAEYVDKRIFK